MSSSGQIGTELQTLPIARPSQTKQKKVIDPTINIGNVPTFSTFVINS